MAKRGKFLKFTVLCVAFIGLFVEICLLAEVSGRSKEISNIDSMIHDTVADIDNIELALSQMTNIMLIKERALQLGMGSPENDQIRVISLPAEYAAAGAHTAEIAGAQ